MRRLVILAALLMGAACAQDTYLEERIYCGESCCSSQGGQWDGQDCAALDGSQHNAYLACRNECVEGMAAGIGGPNVGSLCCAPAAALPLLLGALCGRRNAEREI